jgi:uncharacterized Fe-S cluster-containing radical SAM superfamily protein
LVFWIGQKCTLRCKDCCNLIPYAKQKTYNPEKILEDLKKLVKTIKIKNVQIQGGEPFYYEDIDIIISGVIKLNIENIYIATNGTRLLNEKTIRVLQENPQVKIRVSNYTCTKQKREQLIKQLETYKISYDLYDYIYGDGLWFNSGCPNEPKNKDDNAIQRLYDLCEDKICWTLADGTLTVCGKIPVLKEIRDDYTIGFCDEVDIRNTQDKRILKKKIVMFIKNKKFREHCRYCLGTSTLKKVEAAIQLTN